MRWHEKNEDTWPRFEDFLKVHVPGVLAKDDVRGHFVRTAFKGFPSGPLKPVIGMSLSIFLIRNWGMGPAIWVDRLENAAAIFSKTEKVIVFNRRIIRTFERESTRTDYRGALEMLVLHELLHWAIDNIGGTSDHAPRGGNDLVYDFENAVYPDATTRDRTLEGMNI